MLILTRKVGERITIGDDVVLTVIEVKGRQVKVGISAPSHRAIHREEIYQRIREENRMASGAALEDVEKIGQAWRSGKGPKGDGTGED